MRTKLFSYILYLILAQAEVKNYDNLQDRFNLFKKYFDGLF